MALTGAHNVVKNIKEKDIFEFCKEFSPTLSGILKLSVST